MNSLGSPYRVEFSGGPQDGCFLETEVPLGRKVAVPNTPWGQFSGNTAVVCRSKQMPAAAVQMHQGDRVAEYWLDHAEYRVEDELPQVVFHYRFHGESDSFAAPYTPDIQSLWRLRLRYWLSMQATRFGNWLLTPVDYPLDVRRTGR